MRQKPFGKNRQIEVFVSRYEQVSNNLTNFYDYFLKLAARFTVELSPVSAQNSAAFCFEAF